MCGRYGDKQAIAESFHVKGDISSLSMSPSDYNIAPLTFQPVIRENWEDGSREMVLMRWGLIPFFTKQLSDIKGMFHDQRQGRDSSHESHLAGAVQEEALPCPCLSVL